MPRQFTFRGSRLVYSRGIVALALLASLLIVAFQASVTALDPTICHRRVPVLHALAGRHGAPLVEDRAPVARPGAARNAGSTLRFEPGWRTKMGINAFGALCTAIVALVFAITKFRDGAWIVLLIPGAGIAFSRIHRHYPPWPASSRWSTKLPT